MVKITGTCVTYDLASAVVQRIAEIIQDRNPNLIYEYGFFADQRPPASSYRPCCRQIRDDQTARSAIGHLPDTFGIIIRRVINNDKILAANMDELAPYS
jgi:hypothetical protein